MSSFKSFVILDEDDKGNFDKATDLALMLDWIDFSIDNYLVDSKRYPLIKKALLRGQKKAALVDNDEEDVEDIGGVGGTLSSSTANLDFDDSLNDFVPLEQGSVSHTVSDDFTWPNQNLNVSNFDYLNILERPSSMPASPGGSSTKRRRVASIDSQSPLDRLVVDDDRLRYLEEKIKDQECQRVKMEWQLKAREDELKAL